MADRTEIEWADATWGITLGCLKVSDGCRNCYAIRTAYRQEHGFKRAAYAGLTKRMPDGSLNWTGKVNLVDERLAQPFSWKEPRRIFVDSQSDLFHDAVPLEFLAEVFAVMAQTPHHTYQVLTKRAERMHAVIQDDAFIDLVDAAMQRRSAEHGWCLDEAEVWPLHNVWLGVSVENQAAANERIPRLVETPAAIRFLSCEPLLGPVDIRPWLPFSGSLFGTGGIQDNVAWVIAGGESGPAARPMHPDWVRSLRDQCQAAGVAYFFKQWGQWRPLTEASPRPDLPRQAVSVHHFPDGVKVGRVAAKYLSGRTLDGREWDEMPTFTQETAR